MTAPIRVGGSLFLSGDDEVVALRDRGLTRFAKDQPFTIALWARSDTNESASLVYRGVPSSLPQSFDDRYRLNKERNGFEFVSENPDPDAAHSSQVKLEAPADNADNEWHHLAVVRDLNQGTFSLYLDGQVTDVADLDDMESGGNWDMGIRGTTFVGNTDRTRGPFARSYLDDLGFWRRALLPEEISLIMEGGIASIAGPPVLDSDGDGLPDGFEDEAANGCLDKNVADADQDPDADSLTTLEEFELHTNPCNSDTDGDGLNDNVESDTGVWVDSNNTGTHPLVEDSDEDGLVDGVENPNLAFVDSSQTGTDPNNSDSDGDRVSDSFEIDLMTDPTNPVDVPSVIRGGGRFATTHIFQGGAQPFLDASGARGLIENPGEAEAITVETPYIHFHDDTFETPIFQDLSQPFPLWGPQGNNEGPGARNNYVILSVGKISIAQAGEITFVFNSDEDFELRIDGERLSGTPDLDPTERDNTFMEVNLSAGLHELELFHWVRRGRRAGASLFVYRSTGEAPETLDESEWELLEASNQGPVFRIDTVVVNDGKLTITWPSSPGETFSIEAGTSLQSFETIVDDHASEGEQSSFELELADPAPEVLYVRVRKDE